MKQKELQEKQDDIRLQRKINKLQEKHRQLTEARIEREKNDALIKAQAVKDKQEERDRLAREERKEQERIAKEKQDLMKAKQVKAEV